MRYLYRSPATCTSFASHLLRHVVDFSPPPDAVSAALPQVPGDPLTGATRPGGSVEERLLWHFVGPERHGVDLLVLCQLAERVVAVEVKGTLRRGHWPRLSGRELAQMSVT